MKIPPACSVVKMESDSSLQLGGLRGGEIKSLTAACGPEAAAKLKMVPEQHGISVPRATFLRTMSCQNLICIPWCLIFIVRGLLAH